MRRLVFVLLVMLGVMGAARAEGQSATTLFRVFLADGSTLTSFGEWARVDDRMVFSMPLTPEPGATDLHLVSVPIDRIDLPRTQRYADAVRASHYANSRGESDFAQLSSDVARALNQIALASDPAERLATAERARRALADWPGAHYGYRAREVTEIIGVLDEAIAALRVSAGGPRYDLSLTARTSEPPGEELLGPLDHAAVAEGLMIASTLVTSPAEKVSLLRTLMAFVDRAVGLLPEALASRLRSSAHEGIEEERRIDGVYGTLRATTLTSAVELSARADIKALEKLRHRLLDEDRKLGAKRPEDVSALAATLEEHLESARLLRLQHDQWLMRLDGMRAYKRATTNAMTTLLQAEGSLDDIRTQSGPPPQRLRTLAQRVGGESRRLALIEPPKDLEPTHAVLRSAYELAVNAIQLRQDAATHADVGLARQASSAAAGSLLLLTRARDDLANALRSPIRPTP